MGLAADESCLDRAGEATERLQSVSRLVDEIWRASVSAGLSDEAMHWSDASHCLHRALIALCAESQKDAAAEVFIG